MLGSCIATRKAIDLIKVLQNASEPLQVRLLIDVKLNAKKLN